MNQFEDMRILAETVERGSLSAASVRLGLSKQLVSRRIMALEARLGVQLLVRTTRRLTLTDPGRDFAERARRILAEVDAAEQAMSGHGQAPRGRLRVNAPVSFGTMHLSPLMPGFLRRFPLVELELDLDDRFVDLVAEGYDMAVRIGALSDSTLVARKLVALRLVVCASPDYLRRHGAPATPDALRDHACLMYRHGPTATWPMRMAGAVRDVPVRPAFRANNGEVLRDAAIAGLGLAFLPTFIAGGALRSGALTTVLDDHAGPPGAAYAVHPAHRQRSAAVRAMADYLAACFDPAPSWEDRRS